MTDERPEIAGFSIHLPLPRLGLGLSDVAGELFASAPLSGGSAANSMPSPSPDIAGESFLRWLKVGSLAKKSSEANFQLDFSAGASDSKSWE